MEYRKIIEFGKSSFVVSLPKKWLAELNLGKGDFLYLEESPGRLTIYPKREIKRQETKKLEIDVTRMSTDEINIRLVSAYIQNYQEITFKSKDLKSKAKVIREMVHNLMALEVIEESATKIVAKGFLNMTELSPQTLIQKMDIITREMIADSKKSFAEEKYVNISERDGDVNRLSHLLSRTLHFLSRNPSNVKKLELNHDDVITMWDLIEHLECIADQAKRIAKLMPRLKLNDDEKKQFLRVYSQVEKYYITAMDIYYKKDVQNAVKEMIKAKTLLKRCKDLYRENWGVDWMAVTMEEMKTIIGETKGLLTDVCDVQCCER